jgi:DNA-binding beta-propeller fold protein YncE
MKSCLPSGCWLSLLLVALPSAPAWAHWGEPDEASNINVRRGNEADWIIGDTSGAFISRDHGETWRWLCPEGMGITIWRPERYHWLKGGALLAATGSALIRSDDAGCTWVPHPFFKDTWVTNLAVHPEDERLMYAATGRPSLSNGLYRSVDGGESWTLMLPPSKGSRFASLRLAPSDPQRLYASGQDEGGMFLTRSEDGGQTWTRLDQPLPWLKLPYDLILLTVSEASSRVLWARVSAQGKYHLLRSDDGGATLKPVMETYDKIASAEASPDDHTLWVSTSARLYRGHEGEGFVELPQPEANACTRQIGGALYGCGASWAQGWALARSLDEGTTWTPVFGVRDVQGPHACPATSPVQQQCPSVWPQFAALAGISLPGGDGGPAPVPDAGMPETPVTPSPKGGCATAPGLAPGALLLALFPLARRSRRPRRLLAALAALGLAACGSDDTKGPLKVPELEDGPGPSWPAPAALPPVGPGGRLIITNNMDDTLSLLELDTAGPADWKELARVPVGLNPVELEGPHHTAVSPQGGFYYVGISNYVPGSGSGPHGAHGAGTADGYCLKLDSTTNALVGSVRVDPNPGDVLLSKDGRTLYQTHFDLLKITSVANRGGTEAEMYSRLAIIDADTMTRKAMVPVCPAPHAVRLSPDERRAYIACWSDEVAIVDLVKPDHPVSRVKVAANAGTAVSPRHQPYALTVSPSTGAVWISSLESRALQYLDPVTLTVDPQRTVWLAGPPMFGAFTADGRTLYMPYQAADAIAIIDPEHPEAVPAEIPLASSGCLNVHQVMLTPGERYALAVCEGDHVGPGTFHAVDLARRQVVKTVQVGIFPDSVALLQVRP